MAIVSKAVVPDAALIDPQTLTTLSPHQVACTGMDALTHAIEAYVSTANSPITDLHALEAIRLITAHLTGAVANPQSLDHQGPMMLASLEAGLAFSNAILGAVHAMAHSLGGCFDLPHGECNAILLPGVVAFNYSACPDRFDRVAAVMGVAVEQIPAAERAGKLVARIAALRSSVGIGDNVRQFGVAKTDVARLAGFALQDACMATNPKPMERRDVEAIYEAII